MKLTMKDLDINTYNALFDQLAAATGWEPNVMGMITHYRVGLQDNVHQKVVN